MKLRPSLITSYITGGVCHPGNSRTEFLNPFGTKTARNGLGAELYLLMDADVKERKSNEDDLQGKREPFTNNQSEPLESGSNELTAQNSDESGVRATPKLVLVVHYLAELTDQEIERFAEDMVKRFGETKIIAIATFLPEISSDHEATYSTAIKAIESVCRISLAIGKLNHASPPIVELVCGSITDAVCETSENHLEVPITKVEERKRNLLNRLATALDNITDKEVFELPEIALELEPGKLFLLPDLSGLENFANDISVHPNERVAKKVGFNLDFAHWCIAGVNCNS